MIEQNQTILTSAGPIKICALTTLEEIVCCQLAADVAAARWDTFLLTGGAPYTSGSKTPSIVKVVCPNQIVFFDVQQKVWVDHSDVGTRLVLAGQLQVGDQLLRVGYGGGYGGWGSQQRAKPTIVLENITSVSLVTGNTLLGQYWSVFTAGKTYVLDNFLVE